MTYVKTNDILIPVFDGSDYQNWKKQILILFQCRKYKVVVNRLIITTDVSEDWMEMNIKAMNYMCSAISNKQLE